MYIESLTIVRFGGISDRSFGLGPGVNIIEGSNEAGKTTIASFIRYMLYGFSDKNERNFYCGTFGASGSLVIAEDDNRLRIERESGDGGDRVAVIDLSDNSVMAEDCVPGELILGVPVNVYDRTAYVGQNMGAAVDGGMNEAIENLLFSADESANTAKSLKRLDEARIALRHKNGRGGRISELTSERDALKERLKTASSAHEDIFARESALNALKEKIDKNGALMAELEVKMRRCDDAVLTRQWRELENLRIEAENAAASRDALIADMTHNGFFPDRTYLANLKLLCGELEMLGDELEASRERADFEADQNDRTIYNFSPSAVLYELGGEEYVTKQLRGYHRRRTATGIFGGMLCGLFIAALFFGVLTMMMNKVTGYVLLGAAGALLISAVVLLVIASSVKRREDEILDALGVSSVGEFYEYLPIWRESAQRQQNEDHSTGTNAEVSACEEAYQSKLNELNLLASRWGTFGYDEIIADVEASLDELDMLDDRANEAYTRYDGAKQALGEYSPEELRERIESAPDERELEALGAANLKRDWEFAKKSDGVMRDKLITLERELAASKATAEHPARIAERISELDAEINELTLRADALTLAHEKLSSAAAQLRGSISPKLSEYAGNYLERMTDGKYATLNVDADLSMTYADDSGHLAQKLTRMSAGTSDLAYISLRLALIRLLYRNIRPALILDESFSRLDDDRLACALNVLSTAAVEGTQSIVFTSHKRDADIMDDVGEYDYIRL